MSSPTRDKVFANDRQPPYQSTGATLGGRPDVTTDIPLCAVFIAIYLACAVTSISIFRTNLKRGHKFIISALFTGFCMARVGTCVLRIAWATRLENVSLGIAAQLLVNLGVFLLYIINLLFAQRILRARRPHIGWHRALKAVFITSYICLGLVAVLVISFTVLSFYTLDASLLRACIDIQHAASTYLTVFVVAPYAILLAAYVTKPSQTSPVNAFGRQSIEFKTLILLVLVSLMTLEQGFKYAVSWIQAGYTINDLPWYDSKACFYIFGFMLEVLYILTALSFRSDQLFHVPDGSSKRQTYTIDEKIVEHSDVESVGKV